MKTRKEEFEKKLKVLTNHVHYLGEIYQKKDMLLKIIQILKELIK